jgi:aspartyl-tRNA(Asn)/glutamyl-tRNA(Gln) amidotransferase subunit C
METGNGISKSEVEHIADLSRIELTETEIEKFAKEISDVLGYVKQLQEVDTENVEPIAQVTGRTNVFREDAMEDSGKEVKVIISKNYPDSQDGYIRVKQIL